ncbi:MAG: AAA family ATPase [Methylobacter sp.]|jgi:hypothetical protein
MQNTLITASRSVDTPWKYKPVSLSDELDKIKNGTHKDKVLAVRAKLSDDSDDEAYRAAKRELTTLHFNALFKPDKTADNANVQCSTGLIQFDIDHLKPEEMEVIKWTLQDILTCVFCFMSPSGAGLKVGFRVNPALITNDREFKHAYKQIEAYLSGLGITTDPSCKDMRRACFVTDDPDLYYNPGAEIFPTTPCPPPKERVIPTAVATTPSPLKEAELIRTLTAMAKKAVPGQRHETRLRMGMLAGGLIAAGLVDENEITDLLYTLSDDMSDGGITSAEEEKTLLAAIEHGKSEPVQSFDAAEVFAGNNPINTLQPVDVTPQWNSGDELADYATAPDYLINNILETDSHGLLIGASESFKTFGVLKMAHSICTGTDFFGHQVFSTGKVLYICGEGLGALSRRIKALKIVEGDFNGNLFVLDQPLAIDESSAMGWLSEQIKSIDPLLVICDTFSALSTVTEENSNSEVARTLKLVQSTCKNYRTCSLVIHHTGKDATKGARGAYAFFGNVDFLLEMTRANETMLTSLSCKKMKDGEKFDDINMMAHVVDLGLLRQDGRPTTSLILKPTNDIPQSIKSLNSQDKQILSALSQSIKLRGIDTPAEIIKLFPDCPEKVVHIRDFKESVYPFLNVAQNSKRNTLKRYIEKLQECRMCMFYNDYLWSVTP